MHLLTDFSCIQTLYVIRYTVYCVFVIAVRISQPNFLPPLSKVFPQPSLLPLEGNTILFLSPPQLREITLFCSPPFFLRKGFSHLISSHTKQGLSHLISSPFRGRLLQSYLLPLEGGGLRWGWNQSHPLFSYPLFLTNFN